MTSVKRIEGRLVWGVAIYFLLLVTTASAQSIIGIAGGGSDDGRPATVASLKTPYGIAVDPSGNIFIADTFAQRVRKVGGSNGLISTVAGNGSQVFSGDGGPGSLAGVDYPYAVGTDSAGNLLIADTYSARIRKVAVGSGLITTVAGSGRVDFSGDGGPATSAGLNLPKGVCVDRNGNIFIADTDNNRIRRVAAGTGVITTIAGNGSRAYSGDGGPATAAGMEADALAVDSAGNLYIVDSGNQRIRKVAAATGIISTIAGTGSASFSGDGGPAAAAGLRFPSSICIDSSDNIYIADKDNQRIRKLDASTGVIVTIAGNGNARSSGDGGPATMAELYVPLSIAIDPAHRLSISCLDGKIRQISSDGAISTVAGSGRGAYTGDGGLALAAEFDHVSGINFDSAGNLLICDTNDDRVRIVSATTGIISTIVGTGNGGFSGDGGPATAAQISLPSDVEIDAQGNLYIADGYTNNRVRKVSAQTGIISTIAGNGKGEYSGDGGPATTAALQSPLSLAFDAHGDLYIADAKNDRIRKIEMSSGRISTIAGNGTKGFSGDGGPATQASLNTPNDLTFDAAGNLYIADQTNNRVRMVSAETGLISTVAGNGSRNYFGDGGPATAASLSDVSGVVISASGELYIGDYGNSRLRKVNLQTGKISLVAGNGSGGISGDGGPATAAGVPTHKGVALDRFDNLYISAANRVRVVFKCVAVTAPSLQQPDSGSSGVTTSPSFSWSKVPGAFHYDVFLDTVTPPVKLVAPDVVSTAYAASNLEPLTTYYWQVVAKGDPFCLPNSKAPSEVSSFTTRGSCSPPAPFAGTADPALVTIRQFTGN